MKSAAKIMYTIGKIFSIIEIYMTVIGIIFGILVAIYAKEIAARADVSRTSEEIYRISIAFMVAMIISFLIVTVVLCIASYARRSIDNGRVDALPHIIMIIIWIFGDIFYLLGGVFGIISENDETGKGAPHNWS